MMYSFKNKRGFTLIESLVAIAIVTIAMVAPFTVALHSLQAADISRDELIASQLAQEGLERFRYSRDNSFLNSQAANSATWIPITPQFQSCGTNDYTSGYTGYVCTVDMYNANVTPYSPAQISQIPPLNVFKTGTNAQYIGGYTQNTGAFTTPSKFTRYIQVNQNYATHSEHVTSTVTWHTTNFDNHTITVSEDFYDWP